MATKRYRVDYNSDEGFIVVDIDHEKLTDETLASINDFWMDAEYRLACSDDNVLHAVLKLLCEMVLKFQMDCSQTVEGVINDFDPKVSYGKGGIEGWPKMDGSMGIKIIAIGNFEFLETDFEVKEVN